MPISPPAISRLTPSKRFAAHHQTGRSVLLDFQDDDTYWRTAAQGWVTGTSYSIIAPLTFGAASMVDEAEFDATRWYQILTEGRVEIGYTTPATLVVERVPDSPRS